MKSKFPRPGDNAFLVYHILYKRIHSMLREENNKTCFKQNLVSKFSQVPAHRENNFSKIFSIGLKEDSFSPRKSYISNTIKSMI